MVTPHHVGLREHVHNPRPQRLGHDEVVQPPAVALGPLPPPRAPVRVRLRGAGVQHPERVRQPRAGPDGAPEGQPLLRREPRDLLHLRPRRPHEAVVVALRDVEVPGPHDGRLPQQLPQVLPQRGVPDLRPVVQALEALAGVRDVRVDDGQARQADGDAAALGVVAAARQPKVRRRRRELPPDVRPRPGVAEARGAAGAVHDVPRDDPHVGGGALLQFGLLEAEHVRPLPRHEVLELGAPEPRPEAVDVPRDDLVVLRGVEVLVTRPAPEGPGSPGGPGQWRQTGGRRCPGVLWGGRAWGAGGGGRWGGRAALVGADQALDELRLAAADGQRAGAQELLELDDLQLRVVGAARRGVAPHGTGRARPRPLPGPQRNAAAPPGEAQPRGRGHCHGPHRRPPTRSLPRAGPPNGDSHGHHPYPLPVGPRDVRDVMRGGRRGSGPTHRGHRDCSNARRTGEPHR